MDKSLLKIAGIIALVFGIICCCTIVGVIVGVPLIIGGIKVKDYSEMSDEEILKNKDALLIWSIVFMFLCTVSGILALLYYLNLDNPTLFKSHPSSTNKYDDLERVNKLYKDKVITKEEYESEKERILNK